MSNKLSVIIIGAEGRMGKIHSENIKNIAQKHNAINKIYFFDIAYQKNNDLLEDKKEFYTLFHGNNFSSVDESIKPILSNIKEAVLFVVCTPPDTHYELIMSLLDVEKEKYIFIEKPLTESTKQFYELKNKISSTKFPSSHLRVGYMRNFDPLFQWGLKKAFQERSVGKIFKIVSYLEDPCFAPDNYQSPGIIKELAVHLWDELALFLYNNHFSESSSSFSECLKEEGLNKNLKILSSLKFDIHPNKLSNKAEKYDNYCILLKFRDLLYEFTASRTHAAGYRNETFFYGTEGLIQIGVFDSDPSKLKGKVIISKDKYTLEEKVEVKHDFELKNTPHFYQRFCLAYYCILEDFILNRKDEFALQKNEFIQMLAEKLDNLTKEEKSSR